MSVGLRRLLRSSPAEDEAARTTGFLTGGYRKEHVFYSELGPTVSVRTPEIYTSRFDEEAQRFVIVMEDLSSSAQGDQFAGLSPDQAALAVEEAVGFHAPHWGNGSLAAIIGQSREEGADLIEQFYGSTHEAAIERLGDAIDDETAQLVRDFAALTRQWVFASETPPTLVHLDYRPDNFLFAATPDAPPLVVVDWQTIGAGAGSSDIAYAIGGGFEPDERAAVERPLVSDYADRIRIATGGEYPDDVAWADYRLGSLWGVIISTTAVVLAAQTERGDDMLATMLRRHARHALDLDALALIEP